MEDKNMKEIKQLIEDIYAAFTKLEWDYRVCRSLAEIGKAVAKQVLDELHIVSDWIER